MKTSFALSLLLAVAVFAGCTTTTPNQTAYKVMAATATTVDHAMKAWADYVVWTQTQPNISAVETVRKEGKVKAAYEKYQAAMTLAESVRVSSSAASGTTLEVALNTLSASAGDLVALVNTFLPANRKIVTP